jgi:hypothetical protein
VPGGAGAIEAALEQPETAPCGFGSALPVAERVLQGVLLDVFSDAEMPKWLEEHLLPEATPTYGELYGFKHPGNAQVAATSEADNAADEAMSHAGADAVDQNGGAGEEKLESNAAMEQEQERPAAPEEPSQESTPGQEQSAAALADTDQTTDQQVIAERTQSKDGVPAAAQSHTASGTDVPCIGQQSRQEEGPAVPELSCDDKQWLQRRLRTAHVAAFSEFVLEHLLLGIVRSEAEGGDEDGAFDQ